MTKTQNKQSNNSSQQNFQLFNKKHLILLIIVGIGSILLLICIRPPLNMNNKSKNIYNKNYDISNLGSTKLSPSIKYGFELFMNTSKYIGPNNNNQDLAYAGNNLSCNNCHLKSGTKPYSAPLIGVINRFPQFRGRENKYGTIEERINGCFERSMNGKMMPPKSEEMTALVSYLKWLNRYAPEDGKIEGQGFMKFNIPERTVNLEQGKLIYKNNCLMCHGQNGEGVKLNQSSAYQFPPLWGEDSYNNGAGMTRVITAAQFIKGNMPYGVTYESPFLTDEEAYDVAGYINQQLRPKKPNLELDFPELTKKPVSTPYPPYADDFSLKQHQIGPFQPIIEFYKRKYSIIKTK